MHVTAHQRAIVLGSSKLIAGISGEREFCDPAVDPGEENPIGVPRAEDREHLERVLDDFVVRFGDGDSPATDQAPDLELRDELRALDYVE